MGAAIMDFTDPAIPLPAFLVVDTSVWLNALRPNAPQQPPHHQDACDFVKRLEAEAIAGGTIALVTLPVLEECIFKILQFNFKAEAVSRGLKPHQWPDVYKDSPDVIETQFYPQVEQFQAELSAIPVWIVEPEDLCGVCGRKPGEVALNGMMRSYVESFNLLPQDAFNLAIANRLGVTNIAAIDADFHRADGFTIYTCLV